MKKKTDMVIVNIDGVSFKFEALTIGGKTINISSRRDFDTISLARLDWSEVVALDKAVEGQFFRPIATVSILRDGKWLRLETTYAKGTSGGYIVANVKKVSSWYEPDPSSKAIQLTTPNLGRGAVTKYALNSWVIHCPGQIFA